MFTPLPPCIDGKRINSEKTFNQELFNNKFVEKSIQHAGQVIHTSPQLFKKQGKNNRILPILNSFNIRY